MVGRRPIDVGVVEVHAGGMRIGWIEHVLMVAGDRGRLRRMRRRHR